MEFGGGRAAVLASGWIWLGVVSQIGVRSLQVVPFKSALVVRFEKHNPTDMGK